MPVNKGNWDPSGRVLLLAAAALQVETVSASSAPCDAEILGQRVSAARARGRIPTAPRAHTPPFLGRGWREKGACCCETTVLEAGCCFLEPKRQETSCLKMTGLICSVINQSRNPRWAGSPVCSVLASRAAADLSLILPDKGLCGCISLSRTLFLFTWMLLFSIWDEEVISPPLSRTHPCERTPCTASPPQHACAPPCTCRGFK